MKRRYLYLLLFSVPIVPIVLAAIVAAFAVFGATAGLVWLFVAGDNAWPESLDYFLLALFGLVFIASSSAMSYYAYALGKQQETSPFLNTRHLWAAAGATTLLILAGTSYQWRVGNIGRQSDEVRCSDFCMDKGFAGSGMPPRYSGDTSCSCFDAAGREQEKVPVEAILPRR